MYWLEFILGAVVIIYAGTRLTTYADQLSDRLNLGKAWVGIILLGLVTSLPEAITSLVASVSLNANDLAIGNILGSNNFNPMLIVLMDFVYRKDAITNLIHPRRSHNVSALLAIVLTLIVILEIFQSFYSSIISIGCVSLGSIFIVLLYIGGMKYIARLENNKVGVPAIEALIDNSQASLTKIWVNIVFAGALIVVGAIWLANSADTIAASTGLGRTFVGSIFLAIVTSLPEMVVTLSALKLGAIDLAVGNIFGSNMINIFIVSLCDAFTVAGPILATVSRTHMFTGLLSIVLTCILMAGIYWRNKKSFFGLGLDSIIMIIVFVLGTGILYRLR